MFNSLIEIEAELQNLKPADIDRAALSLEPVEGTSTVLGTLRGEALAAYALSRIFVRKAAELSNRAEYECDTADERRDAMRERNRISAMAKLVAELFWVEARNEIGAAGWDEGIEYGVRQGWKIISRKQRIPSFSSFLSELGGGHE